MEKCPICEKELRKNSSFQYCKNGCYKIIEYRGFSNHIFKNEHGNNNTITIYDDDKENKYALKAIQQIVDYWKKDDRYVVEIASGSWEI